MADTNLWRGMIYSHIGKNSIKRTSVYSGLLLFCTDSFRHIRLYLHRIYKMIFSSDARVENIANRFEIRFFSQYFSLFLGFKQQRVLEQRAKG